MARNSFSKQEIMKEIVKCGKDPVYFIRNYVKISHPTRGLIPFKTFDFQDDLLKDFIDHRFNVILKARQLGISTIVSAYIVWLMMFNRDKNILVVATKFNVAAKLVRKARSIIRHLPAWLKITDVETDNRASIELSNGSIVAASTTSPDAGRSDALSLLVVDEAAHVDGLEDLWMALYPTLSEGGKCIALSTPNGAGNWMHKTYIDAKSGLNDFKHTELMWDRHPNRDQEWFENETRNMSSRQIAQELLCDFLMSGETVFTGDDIVHITKCIQNPQWKTGFDRNLWIWDPYLAGRTYFIAADCARGDGADFSTFHVFDSESMDIVAEYQGRITPDLFAPILLSTGKEYGNAMIVVENNGVGFAVLDKVIDANYPNLYYSFKGTHEFVEQYIGERKTNAVAGFSTTTKTKPLIIAKMEEYVRNKVVKIRSTRLLNEMKTFIWNNQKAEAMRSHHDDLVMACAIGCWVKDNVFATSQRDIEYKKAFLASIKKETSSLTTTVPGMAGHKTNKKDIQHQMNYYMGIYKG